MHINITTVFLVFLLILSTLLGSLNAYKETFTSSLSLQYYTRTYPLSIITDEFNDTSKLIPLKRIPNIQFNDTTNNDERTTLYVSDVYNYSMLNNPKLKLFSVIPDEKCIMFLVSKTNQTLHLKNLKGRILYLNDSDVPLIRVILLSMDIVLEFEIQKIQIQIQIDDRDCLFTLSSLYNTSFAKKYMDQMKFLEYCPISMQYITLLLPLIKKKSIPTSDFLADKKDSIVLSELLVIDMVLYGSIHLEANNDMDDILYTINTLLDTFDTINLMTFYFSFFRQTLTYLSSKNSRALLRSEYHILLQ